MKFREDGETRYFLISEDGRFKMREESRDAVKGQVFYEFAWEREPRLLAVVLADKTEILGSKPRIINVAIDMTELRRSMTGNKYLDQLQRTMSSDDLHELGDIIAPTLPEFYRPRVESTARADLIVNVSQKFDGGEVRNYRNGEMLGGK
jgi:hypothetical protein